MRNCSGSSASPCILRDGDLNPRPPGSRAIKTVLEARLAAGRVAARVRSESLISAESPSPKLRLRAQLDSEGLGQPWRRVAADYGRAARAGGPELFLWRDSIRNLRRSESSRRKVFAGEDDCFKFFILVRILHSRQKYQTRTRQSLSCPIWPIFMKWVWGLVCQNNSLHPIHLLGCNS